MSDAEQKMTIWTTAAQEWRDWAAQSLRETLEQALTTALPKVQPEDRSRAVAAALFLMSLRGSPLDKMRPSELTETLVASLAP